MAGAKLFEDYDPEMEDVFGRNDQLKPKCISVTDEQKADPLRKPKILLQAILVAEKQPMTIKQIESRMMEEDGKLMDPKPYGFSTLDDLMQACPDYILYRRKLDGSHVYSAKVNEANQDIVDLVQNQTDRNEAKHVRSFLPSATGTRAKGSYGASFRSYTGEKLKEEDKVRGTPRNFQARSELGIGKTAARVRNIADVLSKSRQEIGKPHPTIPGKIIVTLAELQKKFMDIYALPPWGKRMSEEDLYNELNKPEYSNILTFWRLKEHGDIYVDEVDAPLNSAQNNKKPEVLDVSAQESNADLTLKTIIEVPSARVHKTSVGARSKKDDDSKNLLRSDSDDDIFPTGPGFGGSRSVSRNSQLTHASMHSDEFSDIARRFGVTTDEDALPVDGRTSSLALDVSLHSSFDLDSHDGSSFQCTPRKNLSPPPAMRPVDVTFSSRAIVPKIPIQSLASFINSRGSVPYDTLPGNEKFLVDFTSDVFKVFATQPGEIKVRLVDPNIDTSTIEFTGNNLRDPIEVDLRWMLESTGAYRRGRQFLKPIMFIPPRGFLLMKQEKKYDEDEESKIEKMGSILKHHMNAKCGELDRNKIRPGSLAVYIFREQQEVRFFRVLILGRAHNCGDVLLLLVDFDDQYFVDAKFEDLFMIPPKTGFKEYPPNVLFATLYGIQGLTEEEQFVMWKNVDDDQRKREVCSILVGQPERLPLVDMIWRDEERNLAWLSQIARGRGAIMQSDQYSAHLERTAEEALPDTASPEENVMDFIDYTPNSTPVVRMENVKVEDDSSDESEQSSTPSPTVISRPFSLQELDMYSLFEKATEQKNHSAIFGLVQFVRNVLPALCEPEETRELLEHMSVKAKEELNISI